jgi:hypothetical protein
VFGRGEVATETDLHITLVGEKTPGTLDGIALAEGIDADAKTPGSCERHSAR